ncbi:MAG: hypothetical protein U0V48_10015 [Anaerolineales bacterium]
MQLFVRVLAADIFARHIVDHKKAARLERQQTGGFGKRQASAQVCDLRQADQHRALHRQILIAAYGCATVSSVSKLSVT